jgi:DNA-binding MarR family transcriptional regulator
MDMPSCMNALLVHLEQNGGSGSNLSRIYAEIGVSYTHLTRVAHQAQDAGLVRIERLPDVGRPVRITITRRLHVLANA